MSGEKIKKQGVLKFGAEFIDRIYYDFFQQIKLRSVVKQV